MKVDCLSIGDVFFDLSIPLDNTKFNMINGGTTNVKSLPFYPGGVGNIATMVSRLGCKSAFCGVVGNDFLGQMYKKDLEKNNVIPRIFIDRNRPTGQLLSLISNGERSFIACRGANDGLEYDYVSKVIRQTCPALIFISGHSLSSKSMEKIILNVVRIADKSGIKVMFDCTPYNAIQLKQPIYHKIIKKTYCLCLNMAEGEALTRKKNVRGIIESLSNMVDLLALKMGKKGCLILTKNEAIRVKAPKVKAIDTTGAGDAFAAAIVYGIVNNLHTSRMASIAVKLSAAKIQTLGPRFYPSQSWIKSLLSR
jgi:sugar/nucleoside kinase (ribokinase family)